MIQTYLSFVVGNELFAVNVIKVLEVLQKQQITKVPNAPEAIKGIINFRGEVVPVFDTRTKFNLPVLETGSTFVIIVLDLLLGNESFRIGAIVDKVKDVIAINDDDIKPVPLMGKDFNTEFLLGIFKINDQFTLLLNVEKIFSAQEVAEIQIVNKTE